MFAISKLSGKEIEHVERVRADLPDGFPGREPRAGVVDLRVPIPVDRIDNVGYLQQRAVLETNVFPQARSAELFWRDPPPGLQDHRHELTVHWLGGSAGQRD